MYIKCPECGSDEFFYVQDVSEYWFIEDIRDDNVDLGERASATPYDDFHLTCEDCGAQYSTLKDYLSTKQEAENHDTK